jgi:AcrR family transcriptional regulator
VSKGINEGQPRRRDEARALFRNAILEAAEGVFAELGFHGARIQDVAERARVGVGTVYNHFAQKEDLLRALVDERTDELLGELAPAEGDKADFAGRLAARITRMLAFFDRHRGFYALVFRYTEGDGGSDEAHRILVGKSKKRIERFRTVFRTLMEEGIADGALEPIEATHLAAFLGGAIKAFALEAVIDAAPLPPAERARLIVRLFLRGAARR